LPVSSSTKFFSQSVGSSAFDPERSPLPCKCTFACLPKFINLTVFLLAKTLKIALRSLNVTLLIRFSSFYSATRATGSSPAAAGSTPSNHETARSSREISRPSAKPSRPLLPTARWPTTSRRFSTSQQPGTVLLPTTTPFLPIPVDPVAL
jgi:hypothetical protein